MKKILAFIFLIIPLASFSQTTKPIEGFLGIKFGASREVVIAALKAKGGIINKAIITPEQVVFSNIKLGHRMADALGVRFFEGKAYGAVFIFKADADPRTIEYYDSLVSDLNEVYGPGESTKVFRTPYSDGDGYEITAIQTDNADYATKWNSNNNGISASISDKLQIILTYIDGPIFQQYHDQEKQKEKSDY